MEEPEAANSENVSIEFHDSDVASVELRGSDVIIHLSPTIVHRSAGIPGVDPGTCWSQDAVLFLTEGQLQGAKPRLPSTLSEGTVTVRNMTHENVIPVGLGSEGPVDVRLAFNSGDRLGVKAQGLNITLKGAPKFMGAF